MSGHVWQGACMARGVCMTGDMHGREACMAGACMQGVCMVGSMCGRGYVWQGACVAGGMHGREGAWQGACMVGEMATAADGMHPTGMHSCCSTIFPY